VAAGTRRAYDRNVLGIAFDALKSSLVYSVRQRRRRRGPARPSWDERYEALAYAIRKSGRAFSRLPAGVQRRLIDSMAAPSRLSRALPLERVDAGGVPGAWLRDPAAKAGRVLYYLHGGGYSIGSVRSHHDLIARMSRAARATGFSIDYRLAPEHPFPAQLDDAVRGYRWLLDQGVEPSRLCVAGESAGGALTLSLLVRLRDEGAPLPAAAVSISPWVDLEATGPSVGPNARWDYLDRTALLRFAGWFAAPEHRRHPLAAPLHADLRGLPPLLVQVGGAEALLDDGRRIAARAEDAGVPTFLHVWQDMIHAWHAFAFLVPQGDLAIAEAGAFLRAQLGRHERPEPVFFDVLGA
jgi:acetyl esterase/lipase